MDRLEKMREYNNKKYLLQSKDDKLREEYNKRKLYEYHNRKQNITQLRNMISDLIEQNNELRNIIKEYEELLEN